jgi:hypothetical protein
MPTHLTYKLVLNALLSIQKPSEGHALLAVFAIWSATPELQSPIFVTY